MTAPSSIDPAHFLHEQLAQASPDLLRQMLTTFIDTLMSAEADAVCGAEYGARSPERINIRNGYRFREFDTRVMAVTHQGGIDDMFGYWMAHPELDLDAYARSLADLYVAAVRKERR